MLVVGDQEVDDGTVAVRTRDGEDRGALALAAFKEQAQALVNEKSLEL
jgi:threonyl-tRNA synthetase